MNNKSIIKEISRWNAAIRSYISKKQYRWAISLYHQMLKSSIKAETFTFSLVINACTSLPAAREGNQIHTHILKTGYVGSVFLGTSLVGFYLNCGCIFLARQVFDEMPQRDIVAWNALISGYSQNGYDLEALRLFVEIVRDDSLDPEPTTLISVLPSCSYPKFHRYGKCVHGYGIKTMLASDHKVMNALTAMYSKCSDLEAARFLFESSAERSVISWNTMISAYGQYGYYSEALFLFNGMRSEILMPNSITITSLLAAIARSESIINGISVHCYVVKTSFDSDISVITSLVCMYAKCGNIDVANSLHGSMPEKNLVSSTAIISCYIENGHVDMALQCFSQMLRRNAKLDAITMVGVLTGFTDPSYLEIGMALHGYGVKSSLACEVLAMNGLISMYTRCGDTGAALSLFHGMKERPLITWNSIISGCVQTGHASNAFVLFHQMQFLGYQPDHITLVSMLSGCSHLGFLHFGKRLHNYIFRNDLELGSFICTSLIDMYAKCGSIESAERVFTTMAMKLPQNLATLNAMILAFGLYGMEDRAFELYTIIIEQGLKPDDITFIGLLSACSHAGLVTQGWRYFQVMSEEFDIVPGLQHCSCMVDLLARAGCLDEAVSFVKNMDMEPDSAVWGALLAGCCMHQNIRLGESLAKQLFLVDYRNIGFYILMSNLYAATGRWVDVASVRNIMMRDIGCDSNSGCSLIEGTSMHFFGENKYLADSSSQILSVTGKTD